MSRVIRFAVKKTDGFAVGFFSRSITDICLEKTSVKKTA